MTSLGRCKDVVSSSTSEATKVVVERDIVDFQRWHFAKALQFIRPDIAAASPKDASELCPKVLLIWS